MLDRLPALGPAVFAIIAQTDYFLLSPNDREHLYTQYMDVRERPSEQQLKPSSSNGHHYEILDALMTKCSPKACKWLLELE